MLVITGPTAAGKTAVVMELARHVPVEVISADSRQVYRGLDVGTAKPTPAQRRRVPHHGVDVVRPDEPFSAHAFVQLARAAIPGIRARGRTPIVVGGTGFYIKAWLEGSALGGAGPNRDLRHELDAILQSEGPPALWRRLRAVDPRRAAAVDPHNPRRLIRAIELAESSERLRAEPDPLPARVLALDVPAATLRGRIEARVDRMYAAGLVAEMAGLLACGYAPDVPALSGIGYREAAAVLDGTRTLEAARQCTAARTRQYARRQRTWFRHQLHVDWIALDDIVDAALAHIRAAGG